jgi:outer membrane protein assembly factor BamB
MSFGLSKVFTKHGGRIIESWVFDAKSPMICPATVVEHEGVARIFVGTKKGDLLCVDDLGNQVWSYSTKQQLGGVDAFFVDEERVHSIDAAPVVADVDLDGKPEVLVGTETGTLSCISLAGKLLWKHDCGGPIKAAPLVADINGDGYPEIVIGSSNNKITALTGTGKKLFEFMTESPVESVPGLIRGKRPLIVFGTNDGSLIAITPAQDRVWRVDLKSRITAAPAMLHDEEEERIVIGTTAGEMFCISENGELVWQFKTYGSIYSAATVCDLNKDRKPEVVFGSCDNCVYALSGDGKKLWSFETDFWVTTTPIVADIDGDEKAEVIVGSYDHNVYVLDAEGSYMLNYVPGISDIVNQAGHYANMLTSDPSQATGKKLYQYKTGGIVVGCSLLSREGKTALIVNVKTGTVGELRHEA